MIDRTKPNKSTSSKSEESIPDDCMADIVADSQHSCVNITDMIRSLQRTEGLTDCFRRGLSDCDQLECAWRRYCLSNTDGLPPLSES
ncbi:MAG: hypothetical protein PVJ84_08180 [Desulfobacteraceae bacterium]|jgi:hypothetical protein